MGNPAPPQARMAFQRQALNAKRRGIPFLFTFDQWWDWWQTDDRWSARGRQRDQLVMARHGDSGAYEPGNVYCATNAENMAATDAEKRSTAMRKSWEGRTSHLAVRGVGHPRSKAVITPAGQFGSAALAGEAHGISRVAAKYRADKGLQGWLWA